MPSKRFRRVTVYAFAIAALVLAGVSTTASASPLRPAAVATASPVAVHPAKGPAPRGEFAEGHIRVRGMIRGHYYCISTEAHPRAGSFLYMAPCEPRDANEWWHCVKYYSFGSCAPASNPTLDLGQSGRSALAQMVRPDHAGKNWILQFLPLSASVSVIKVAGFHGYYLTYPDTAHKVNPVFWGTGRNRGWSTELVLPQWRADPL
jgi:hypothetical protein